jgi:hypothetical protein
MVHDKPRHLPAKPGADFVGRPVVNSRIDACLDDLVDAFAEGRPTALEAGIGRTGCNDNDAGVIAEQQG